MGRKIEVQGERKNVYLSKEVIDTVDELSKVEGLNFSQMLSLAVMQMKESENPEIALQKVQAEIILREKEIQELKAKEIELRKLILGANKWKQNMESKKYEALRILVRKISNREMQEAERIAKTWGRILHKPYIDLLNEANAKVQSGI